MELLERDNKHYISLFQLHKLGMPMPPTETPITVFESFAGIWMGEDWSYSRYRIKSIRDDGMVVISPYPKSDKLNKLLFRDSVFVEFSSAIFTYKQSKQ